MWIFKMEVQKKWEIHFEMHNGFKSWITSWIIDFNRSCSRIGTSIFKTRWIQSETKWSLIEFNHLRIQSLWFLTDKTAFLICNCDFECGCCYAALPHRRKKLQIMNFRSIDGSGRWWPLDQLLMQTFGYYICKWGKVRCSEYAGYFTSFSYVIIQSVKGTAVWPMVTLKPSKMKFLFSP